MICTTGSVWAPHDASPILHSWGKVSVWPRYEAGVDSKVIRAILLAGCYSTLVEPLMTSRDGDSDDEAMGDPVELEMAGEPRAYRTSRARGAEAQGVRARGTRERPVTTPEP